MCKMFIGYSITGTDLAWMNGVAGQSDIVTLSFTNMVIDELYATKNILVAFDWNIPQEWEFETHLHGTFQNTTYAGNIDYSEKIVQRVKIKKRFQGDFNWKTVFEKEITSINDFATHFVDYLEPSNRTVEYAYVAVVSTPGVGIVDTDIATSSVYSQFDSYFMVGQEESYPLVLDTTNDITYNRTSTTIVSPGSKYPYVVSNGISRYYSGKLKTTFIELKDGDFDTGHGWDYRNHIDAFLTDGRAKILKSYEGDLWMVNITGSLPRTSNQHVNHVTHELEWVECGDPASVRDLYDNGFINTNTDKE